MGLKCGSKLQMLNNRWIAAVGILKELKWKCAEVWRGNLAG
jgi:hypothetical protein